MTSGLEEFWEHLRQISRIAAWVLPTAGISPIVASLVGLNPPWPNRVGLTAATSAAVLFTLVAVFQFLDARKRRLVNRVMALALAVGVVFALVYFSLFGFLIYKPDGGEPFAKGFQCTVDAQLLHGDKCPWLDHDELKIAEYQETRLWTLPSIAAARISLLFAWFAMFALFSAFLGAFVRYQAIRKV